MGITAAILEGGENLNFAIPINEAKRLLLNQSAKLRTCQMKSLPPPLFKAIPKPDALVWQNKKLAASKLN